MLSQKKVVKLLFISFIVFFCLTLTKTANAQTGSCSFTPQNVLYQDANANVTVTANGVLGQVSLRDKITANYSPIGRINDGQTLTINIPSTFPIGTYEIIIGGYHTVCSGPQGTDFLIQSAQVQCQVDGIYFSGQEYTPGTFDAEVPGGKGFWVYITCTSLPAPNPHDVTVTIGGITRTKSLSYVAHTLFGEYFNLPIDQPNSVKTFPISIQVSGLLTNCTGVCSVNVHSGSSSPMPTPVPDPSCLTNWRYNPGIPTSGQPFQIQFVPNSENLRNGIYRYAIAWQANQPTNTVSISGFLDLASTYGIWAVNLSGVNTQFSWKVLFDNNPCGTQNTLFSSTTATPTPSPLGATGQNPCIERNSVGELVCETAIGKIPTNLGGFASALLRIALGISGGIVLILMVIGSIRVMTSSGDPQRVASGRDMIVAAIAGALFIAFSVMIMQFLGTAIVPIPGLVFGT